MDAREAGRRCASAPGRWTAICGIEPRALHACATRTVSGSRRASERVGDCAGAVLCACDGTWVAHGSGAADREIADRNGRLPVPPDDPRYVLRRVWLTKEEEEGYYYGFSNEGLWPLCHIAHTRPIFRDRDWKQYQEVNQKFAEAVLEEMRGVENPIVLVQDYHFALLPRLSNKKPRRSRRHFLAHSLAQSRDVWDLPVAA